MQQIQQKQNEQRKQSTENLENEKKVDFFSEKQLYIEYLEKQAEKLEQIIFNQHEKEAQFEELSYKLKEYEEKFYNITELIKCLQQFADSQEQENNQLKRVMKLLFSQKNGKKLASEVFGGENVDEVDDQNIFDCIEKIEENQFHIIEQIKGLYGQVKEMENQQENLKQNFYTKEEVQNLIATLHDTSPQLTTRSMRSMRSLKSEKNQQIENERQSRIRKSSATLGHSYKKTRNSQNSLNENKKMSVIINQKSKIQGKKNKNISSKSKKSNLKGSQAKIKEDKQSICLNNSFLNVDKQSNSPNQNYNKENINQNREKEKQLKCKKNKNNINNQIKKTQIASQNKPNSIKHFTNNDSMNSELETDKKKYDIIPNKENTLCLNPVKSSKNQIQLSFSIADNGFNTSIWYEEVDLLALEKQYGIEYIHDIYFHILIFEAIKIIPYLRPVYIDYGIYEKYVNQEFEDYLQSLIQSLIIQKNQDELSGQKIIYNLQRIPEKSYQEIQKLPIQLVTQISGTGENQKYYKKNNLNRILCFQDNSKESCIQDVLLNHNDIQYSTVCTSYSYKGDVQKQQDILKKSLQLISPQKNYTQLVIEDFYQSPIFKSCIQNKENLKEKSSSFELLNTQKIFNSFPVILQDNYRYINLIKPQYIDNEYFMQYELKITKYIQKSLINNVQTMSVLSLIQEPFVFNLLNLNPLPSIKLVTNCQNLVQNIDFENYNDNGQIYKCQKCLNCCYQWLNFIAYLPIELVYNEYQKQNLLDQEQNLDKFAQILGLQEELSEEQQNQWIQEQDKENINWEDQNQQQKLRLKNINEDKQKNKLLKYGRIVFEIAKIKGMKGKAIDLFEQYFQNEEIDLEKEFSQIFEINRIQHNIPQEISFPIIKYLQEFSLNFNTVENILGLNFQQAQQGNERFFQNKLVEKAIEINAEKSIQMKYDPENNQIRENSDEYIATSSQYSNEGKR
ncbi:hypothetical protein PPERSA_07819 [Pseudocohnilembus persalinus]|uniref:Uncharacterized protein n=1 Tax=Pseudocohnilembus persalinus TaxID=266149 RepID=A0A0V0QBY4_PSEPJ|nr:hypothetical protein PPERSA_07819 [Pseudocohnilembus persalinus]|eukprot:KRW99742.1 hypothetical protein PPERSA_07819 [Pseudocohnilembus persalinus]